MLRLVVSFVMLLGGTVIGWTAFIKGFGLSVVSWPWLIWGYFVAIILLVLANAIVREKRY